MFDAVARIYENTKNKQYVAIAVKRNWISSEDYLKITGAIYE
jgi:hypothetical protein